MSNLIGKKRQILSEEECFDIIVTFKKHLKTSTVINSTPLNKQIRHSKSAFFESDDINKRLSSRKVRFQFTEYQKTGFYRWHQDNSNGRIVTHIISLNKEYTGGELQLMHWDQEVTMRLNVGESYSFPSEVLHRVQPVLSGVRYSLVGWEVDEPFDKEESEEPIREESDELVALDRMEWKNDWREY